MWVWVRAESVVPEVLPGGPSALDAWEAPAGESSVDDEWVRGKTDAGSAAVWRLDGAVELAPEQQDVDSVGDERAVLGAAMALESGVLDDELAARWA